VLQHTIFKKYLVDDQLNGKTLNEQNQSISPQTAEQPAYLVLQLLLVKDFREKRAGELLRKLS